MLFNEITKKAVQEAIANPQELDRNKFDAQQARRVLDRLVGYQISPLLWDKVRRGLSAGRVQSVAVRLVCEREREMRAFETVEYWTMTALAGRPICRLRSKPSWSQWQGQKVDNKKFRLENEDAASRRFVKSLDGAPWVDRRGRAKRAAPLSDAAVHHQHAAAGGVAQARLPAQAHDAARAAALRRRGARHRRPVGLITYMRTDSTRVSNDALDAPCAAISSTATARTICPRSRTLSIEEERAGRPRSDPSDVARYPPERVRRYLRPESSALHADLESLRRQPDGAGGLRSDRCRDSRREALFRATGQQIKFDGFMRVYTEGRDERAAQANGEDEDEMTRRIRTACCPTCRRAML